MKKIIIEHEYDGYEVGEYLKEVHGYSGRRLRNLDIYLNGKKIKNNAKKVRKLNRLVIVEKEKSTGILAKKIDLDIVFEDDDLLIVNKEANLVVHPTQKKTDLTLANGIVYYFQEKLGKTIVPRFFNRLDMNTSGLIIITKNSHSQYFLQNKGNVEKEYYAIVNGIVEKDEFFIEKPIGKIGDDLRRWEISVEKGGKEAKSFVKVLTRNEEKNVSLLQVKLFTGRTHQIRAHLSLIGHPIVGDELYGGNTKHKEIKRQLLHSFKLNFISPSTKIIQEIIIEMPKDMKDFLNF